MTQELEFVSDVCMKQKENTARGADQDFMVMQPNNSAQHVSATHWELIQVPTLFVTISLDSVHVSQMLLAESVMSAHRIISIWLRELDVRHVTVIPLDLILSSVICSGVSVTVNPDMGDVDVTSVKPIIGVILESSVTHVTVTRRDPCHLSVRDQMDHVFASRESLETSVIDVPEDLSDGHPTVRGVASALRTGITS